MGMINNLFKQFTDEVCSEVKCSEIHPEIKEELLTHLEDIREEYISQGSSLEEADRLAVAHMGDSEKIGHDLNKVYEKKPEYKTIVITLLIVALGLFVQFGIARSIDSFNPKNSLTFTLIGIILGIAAYFCDYRKLEKYSVHIFLVACLLIIISQHLLGIVIGGYLFLDLIGVHINIAYLSNIMIIISLNGIFPKLYSSSFGIIKIILIFAVSLFMIILTGQFTYIFIFTFTALALLIYIGIPKKYIATLCMLGIAFISYPIIKAPYRLARVKSFFNFYNYSDNSHYINYQIHKLLYSSTIWGNGSSKYILDTLPDLKGDFIYSYIIYTFGFAFGLFVLVLILSFLINLFITSGKIKNNYGKSLLRSISTIFAIQFLFSILMNLNLGPTLSVTMPFISYGGANLVGNLTLIGLICSIYARKNLKKNLLTA